MLSSSVSFPHSEKCACKMQNFSKFYWHMGCCATIYVGTCKKGRYPDNFFVDAKLTSPSCS